MPEFDVSVVALGVNLNTMFENDKQAVKCVYLAAVCVCVLRGNSRQDKEQLLEYQGYIWPGSGPHRLLAADSSAIGRGRSGDMATWRRRKFIIFITRSDHDKLTFIKAGPEPLQFAYNVLSMTVNATPNRLVKKLFNQRSN